MSDLGPIEGSQRGLEAWISSYDFAGWDPFDALSSPLLQRLTFNNRRVGQIWIQLFKRSPVNLRPLFGISRSHNAKGMGLFLASYLRKYQLSRSSRDAERVRYFATWLVEHSSAGYHGACWGYPFDWPNREFFAKAGMPTVVNTSFIGLAFLDLHDLEGELKTGIDALAMAKSSCQFILDDLQRQETDKDEICFSYTPIDRRWIHNANLLGAWLLAATAARAGDARLAETALAAARFTSRRQRAEGWWPYGEAKKEGWVDSFHTGFVLVALKNIGQLLKVTEFDDATRRGYWYWRRNFLLPDGAPKYFAEQKFPMDAHCAAQAIMTLIAFADWDKEALELAKLTASWTIQNLQDPNGYFYYQKHALFRNKVPYMRWSEAWMHRALVELDYQGGRYQDGADQVS